MNNKVLRHACFLNQLEGPHGVVCPGVQMAPRSGRPLRDGTAERSARGGGTAERSAGGGSTAERSALEEVCGQASALKRQPMCARISASTASLTGAWPGAIMLALLLSIIALLDHELC